MVVGVWVCVLLNPIRPDGHIYPKQSLTEQLKRTRDDEEAQYLNQKMQAVIARLYCMTGSSKVQGPWDEGDGWVPIKREIVHPPT